VSDIGSSAATETEPAVIDTGYVSPNAISASNGDPSLAVDGDLSSETTVGYGETLTVAVDTASVVGVMVNFGYIGPGGASYTIESADGTELVSDTLSDGEEGNWFSFLFDGLFKTLILQGSADGGLGVAEIEVEREILPEHIHQMP
jgi:hypothetical protein